MLLRISAQINISTPSQKVSISIKLDQSGFIENLMVPEIQQKDKYLERSGGMCVLIIVVFNLKLFSANLNLMAVGEFWLKSNESALLKATFKNASYCLKS